MPLPTGKKLHEQGKNHQNQQSASQCHLSGGEGEREMGFAALRTLVGPVVRTLVCRTSACSAATVTANSPILGSELGYIFGSFHRQSPWMPAASWLHSLTDTRFPKRRPSDMPRRKRASLRPPGPYAWVKHTPGEPVLPNNPNDGSVKARKQKKRMRQRRAFILAEAKKRKAQMQEAKRKKNIKRVERKMAAVAREKVWAQRLEELQWLEEEKKKSVA